MAQQQVISLTAFRHDRAYQALLTDLDEFCRNQDPAEITWAELQFYGAAGPDPDWHEDQQYAFLDWFAFGHPTPETGRLLVSLFAEQRSDPTEQELLAAWERTRPGFYHVIGGDGPLFRLRDAHTGAALSVDFRPGPPAKPGGLLYGRLLPTEGVWRPGFELVALQAEAPAALEPLLDAEAERMRRAWPAATRDDLLRERWPVVRDLINLALLSLKEKTPLALPPTPAGQSLGRTAPHEGAPPQWAAVADEVRRYADRTGISFTEAQNALRLWWDAAEALRPRIARPEVWAAGVAYAWHHWASHDDTTQVAVAAEFGVSAPTVSAKARDIARALDLDLLDDRYAHPLDPRVRAARLLAYLPRRTPAAPTDPIWAFGKQNPAGLAAAQRLNDEVQELLNKGRLEAARKKCREALRHCPVFVPARNNLAVISLTEGDPAAAIREAEPGLQTHPEYVFTLSLLARAHHRLKQTGKARERLEQALAVYRHWQEEQPEYLQHKRQSDRTALWETLAEMGHNRTLYDLAHREDLSGCTAWDLARAAVAADRCNDRKRAGEWLRLGGEKAPDWRLPGALATAVEKIETGAVPAFHLDYDFTLASMERGAKRLGASVRAVIIAAIWSGKVKEAEDEVRTLQIFKDPWAAQLLRAVLLRPDLPDSVKTMAISSLVAAGELRPGDHVLLHRNGLLQAVRVNAGKE